jgi:DNA-binding response OmpR family regulator
MSSRILIADDEPGLVRVLQMHLESRGYEVCVALDGREALRQLDIARPDLIILDVAMPYADGFEVLEVIRASPDTREIPVIMVTAKDRDSDIVQGWRTGADCYLTKPIDVAELTAFVDRIMNPPNEEEQDQD